MTADVEGILNSRPLTFGSSEDLEEPLTPSRLMTGVRLLTPEPLRSSTGVAQLNRHEECTRRYRYVKQLLEHFWSRWQHQYLLDLKQYQEAKHTIAVEPVVGAVVVIKEDGVKRNHWRLGQIKELIRGSNGRVRGVQVVCAEPGGGQTVIHMPVQKLVPVEIPNAKE